ncbi:L,D-transpeptidase [Streptomyces sp. NBC_00885]|uniref:L,D-transpeptidase n=1 Tax=Streptomyces sp. NBC_00885 TaxID=2975857 RepID=UPI003868DA4C|nr:L,D-transpeptidase [Streptomyces sp. NBC_00885]
MSEHEPDALGSALRVLAADAQAPPSLSGGQIRRRGEARGRRRRVAGTAAVAALLVAGVALGVPQVMGAGKASQPPAASTPSPSLPKPPPLAAASLDTQNKVLTVTGRDGRSRSIDVSIKEGTALIRLTVDDKYPKGELPDDLLSGGKYVYGAQWVVKLTRTGGSPVYIAQASKNTRFSSNVIAVGSADAKWVYDQLDVGDVIVPN